MAQPSSSGEARKGRGTSWTHAETADLIALWSQPHILDRLRNSFLNAETFKELAAAMRAKGHQRTWEECRRKTKNLRSDYKKFRDHRARTGRGPSSMPFYKELHAFLATDGSIRPSRIGTSSDATRVPVGQTARAQAREGTSLGECAQELLPRQGDQEEHPDSDETSCSQRAMDISGSRPSSRASTSSTSRPASRTSHWSTTSSRTSTHRDRSPVPRTSTALSDDDSEGEERAGPGPFTQLIHQVQAAHEREVAEQGEEHEDEVANPRAAMPPAARLAEIRGRRTRRPASAAHTSVQQEYMERSIEIMEKAVDQDKQIADRSHEMTERYHEMTERFYERSYQQRQAEIEDRRLHDQRMAHEQRRLADSLQALTGLMGRMVDVMERSQRAMAVSGEGVQEGGRGRAILQGQEQMGVGLSRGRGGDVPPLDVEPAVGRGRGERAPPLDAGPGVGRGRKERDPPVQEEAPMEMEIIEPQPSQECSSLFSSGLVVQPPRPRPRRQRASRGGWRCCDKQH